MNPKTRGMTELVETVQNDYPRPIPVPVDGVASSAGQLRTVSLAS